MSGLSQGSSRRLQNRASLGRAGRFAATAAVFVTLAATTKDAGAAGPVEVTGKGIVGCGLLGAEAVTITMGAIGVNKGWPYFVFGGVGMIGGGIGGYFLEKATAVKLTGTFPNQVQSGGPAEPALYVLAGGMALVIPALIISLNATAYKPPESDRNEPASNEPSKEPPKPDSGPPAPPGAAPPAPGGGGTSHNTYQYRSRFRSELAGLPHIPVSLFDMYKGKLGLGVPAPEVRPLYTQRELYTYGVAQGTEVRLPVFKAMF
jgi:hypothetical protein